MKTTKLKSAASFMMLLLLMAFSPAILKAQCPTIQNQLTHCQIEVNVKIYKMVGGSCTVLCSNTNIGMGVSSTVPITCGPCIPFCNIQVTIVSINGVAVTPGGGTAGLTTFAPGSAVAGPASPCIQPNASPRIYYDPTGTGQFRIVL